MSADEGRELDEDAAWRSIVENYGEPPPPAEPQVELPSVGDPVGPLQAWQPDWQPTPWEDEGHFVPPEPPPLPRLEPRRRLAWLSLVAGPVVLLVAVFFGWSPPTWLTTLVVLGFLAGFGYLVSTMPRHRDDWSGDDGAVV
ncbi:MAG: hypothetical protein ACRDPI_04800 [Nocardioidaceae bacterium]